LASPTQDQAELHYKKHGKGFEIFTKDIENKVTPELENDRIGWKGQGAARP